jgi:hypothetical protein
MRNDEYKLRSVVLSEVNKIADENNLVIGSTAAVMIHQDPNENRFSDEFILYDPYSVVLPQLNAGGVVRYDPIQSIAGVSRNPSELAFMDIARTRGIIFMYQLTTDSSSGTITF